MIIAVVAIAALPSCADDGSGVVNNPAAIEACEAVCAAELAACPALVDGPSCASECEAYGFTVDAGACQTAFVAWQECERTQGYTCSTTEGQTYAVPADPDACDAERDTFDACE